MAEHTFPVQPGLAYAFEFTNYKSTTAQRVVIARGLFWGSTPWHKELQWFLDGFDVHKNEVRQFPLSGIRLSSFRRFTDEEMDMHYVGLEKAAEARGIEQGKVESKEEVDG